MKKNKDQKPIAVPSPSDVANAGLGEDVFVKLDKPIKAKPVFYAICYEPLKAIAKEMGYNLLINGSLNRDMDLVAIPWVDNPQPMIEVIIAFDKYLRGVHYDEKNAERSYYYSVLPGGRHSYVINLNRGGKWNQYADEQWYLDISFTPCISEYIEKIESLKEQVIIASEQIPRGALPDFRLKR